MIHHDKRDKQIKRERGEREARKREIERKKPKYLHLTPEEKNKGVNLIPDAVPV